MRPSAARLLLFSNSASYRRLAGIVAGVAAALAMLLILLGTYLHLPDREDRAAWISQEATAGMQGYDDEVALPAPGASVILTRVGVDYVGLAPIDVVRVATTQDTQVALPACR